MTRRLRFNHHPSRRTILSLQVILSRFACSGRRKLYNLLAFLAGYSLRRYIWCPRVSSTFEGCQRVFVNASTLSTCQRFLMVQSRQSPATWSYYFLHNASTIASYVTPVPFMHVLTSVHFSRQLFIFSICLPSGSIGTSTVLVVLYSLCIPQKPNLLSFQTLLILNTASVFLFAP
ncbi:hypothetical protein SISSUDRAFT_817294 [Sistotremastrum suecicum HHB10207 ss-3]|uniref:Uncharacterized protein n=1 Tax=Sistotremastrum suecicum HHB10207 ss-3 TaxID=1314776 RepID=A0A166CV42_9AGAM|nr:hypothetical protein SISSUDRAFT_817294 [Sistotremastrum suecicum HHB10207 ss-3]